MADDPKTPPAAEPEKEQTYEADYLIRNSRALLKTSRSVVAGALSTAKGNRVNFTIEEAQDLIKAHKKRPVEFAGSES